MKKYSIVFFWYIDERIDTFFDGARRKEGRYVVLSSLPNGTSLTCHMEFFWDINPTYFFYEIGWRYVSIIITIISNYTVLVSYDVICFGYFIPMSYSVNKKVPPIVPHPLTLPGF